MEIDLKVYWFILRKRLKIVFLLTALTMIAAAVLNFFILPPVYQANTTLYVAKNENSKEDITYKDMLMTRVLVNDYRELVNSRLIANKVIQELNLEGITLDDFSKMLSVNSKNDTRVLEISVENKNPELARDIANKVAEIFMPKALELMDVVNVQLIDVAITPEEPVKPEKIKNIALATIMVFLLSVFVIIVIEFLNNTVKSSDDAKKYLELPVIGDIPKIEDKN